MIGNHSYLFIKTDTKESVIGHTLFTQFKFLYILKSLGHILLHNFYIAPQHYVYYFVQYIPHSNIFTLSHTFLL